MMPVIGVLGGLSPQLGMHFSLKINDVIKAKTNQQPNLIIHNLPLTIAEETSLLSGSPMLSILHHFKQAIVSLNNSNASTIIIPCNSAHHFLDVLRDQTPIRIIDIIENTTTQLSTQEKIGILATPTTTPLYKALLPNLIISKQQHKITTILKKLVKRTFTSQDQGDLLTIIDTLRDDGAEKIILGCTDLSLVNLEASSLPLIDSCKELEKTTSDAILESIRVRTQ